MSTGNFHGSAPLDPGLDDSPIAFELQLLTIQKAIEDLARSAKYQQHQNQQQHQKQMSTPGFVTTATSSPYYQHVAFKPVSQTQNHQSLSQSQSQNQNLLVRPPTTAANSDLFVRPQPLGAVQVKFDPFAPVTSFSPVGSVGSSMSPNNTLSPSMVQANMVTNPNVNANANLNVNTTPESLSWSSKVWGKPSGMTAKVWG